MDINNVNARVYPMSEPKGKTLAFANITIDNIATVKSLRIVDGKKGLFVTMPQSQDKRGMYHDIAFPLNKELRDLITSTVLAEFDNQLNLPPDERGYDNAENDPGRSIDVKLDTKIFPLKEPKGETLAFANVGFNNAFVIRGIRILETDKGKSIVMPQSKDKEGNLRDVAYPISVDLRIKISKLVLETFKEQFENSERSIEEKFTDGSDDTVQSAQPSFTQFSETDSSPELED